MKLLSIFGGFPVVFLPRGLSGSPHLSQFFSCGTSTICSHTAMEASFLISHLCHFNCLELFQGLLYPFPRQLNSYPGPTLHAALLHLHSGHSLPTTKLQLQSPPRFLQAFAPAPGNSAYLICCCCCSVTKSCPILQPHGDCSTPGLPLSLFLGVCSNSCPLSQWYHLSISSSVIPFSSCSQSFPASMSFQMRQFFTSGGHSIGASNSASVLQMNTQGWFPLGWTGWISLQSKGLSGVFSNSSKVSILWHSAFIKVQLSHLYMTTGKTIALTTWTFVSKVVSLLFNMLSRFIIACCSSHKSAEVSAMMSLPWPPICSSHPSYMMLFKPYINLLLFLLSISSPLQASH